LMAAAAKGGDRQKLHERIRKHAHAAGQVVKMDGKPNDLIDRLAADDAFAGLDLRKVLEPRRYVGRAPEQVDEFIKAFVTPIRRRYRGVLNKKVELNV